MSNIIEAIQAECNRCREVVKQYERLGQVGMMGKTLIEADIREGEAAIASGDYVRMVQALRLLQGCE